MNKTLQYFVISALTTGLLVGIYSWQGVGDREVIARVGDIVIDRDEFLHEMKLRGGRFVHQLDKQALLDEMIDRKLLLGKAAELKYSEDPTMKRQYENILIAKVQREHLDKQKASLSVTDAELKQYYESHLKDFEIPGKDRLAILFVARNRPDEQIAINKLKEISALANNDGLQLNASVGFGAYAVSHSDHQVSRYKGGEIGWFKQNAPTYWEESVLKAGFSLSEPGDISDLVNSDKGHYLVRLMERKAASSFSFEQVKRQINSELTRTKHIASTAEFYKKLKQSLGVEIDTEALALVHIEAHYAGGSDELLPPSTPLN